MSEPLNILFVTSEMAPLVSTGGLAEVAAALPRALKAQGHDVRVVMPAYRSIPEEHRGEHYCLCVADMLTKTEYGSLRTSTVPDSDIPLYLVEHEGYFGRERPYGVGAREYDDNAERFCFFCLAVLHGIPQTGWIPDVVHGHDWHTAPLPTFLKARFHDDPVWGGIPNVFTIHNLAFQGRYGADKFGQTGLPPELMRPECLEYEGDMNLMKAAVYFAEKISTVSPRYAREIQTLDYGTGLDGMLRTRSADLHGILNGVDYTVWNPETDPHIAANFSAEDLTGKAACKAALQNEFGLPERDVPIFGIVSRLFWQKGIDLVVEALERIVELDVQIVVLGTGDPDLERALTVAAKRYPEKLGLALKYDMPASHRVQAGSDFHLMPSRYEPCGLSQMYGMAYGAIPVVRRTGGLADSVRDLNPVHKKHANATGISFVPLTAQALVRALERAVSLYQNPVLLGELRCNAMGEDFSWERASRAYVELYREAIAAQ